MRWLLYITIHTIHAIIIVNMWPSGIKHFILQDSFHYLPRLIQISSLTNCGTLRMSLIVTCSCSVHEIYLVKPTPLCWKDANDLGLGLWSICLLMVSLRLFI